MPAAERRRYALTGPQPPQWHAAMRPAPWITPAVISEGARIAGASLVTVPPGHHTTVPAQTRPDVPPDVPPPPAAAPPAEAGGDGEMITGIDAAARYLGYDKPDSFRRARTRNPIPEEARTSDGRPTWTPQALRSWHSKRKIAGGRATTGRQD
jgi:hypothetical protein